MSPAGTRSVMARFFASVSLGSSLADTRGARRRGGGVSRIMNLEVSHSLQVSTAESEFHFAQARSRQFLLTVGLPKLRILIGQKRFSKSKSCLVVVLFPVCWQHSCWHVLCLSMGRVAAAALSTSRKLPASVVKNRRMPAARRANTTKTNHHAGIAVRMESMIAIAFVKVRLCLAACKNPGTIQAR